jgi:hypothetical protein
MNWRGVLAAAVGLGLAGCGGSVSNDQSTGGAGGAPASGGAPSFGGAPSLGGTGGVPKSDAGTVSTCDAQAELLAGEIQIADSSCATVVRLSEANLAVEGYALVCGGYGSTDEASARAQASAATGYGNACSAPPSLSGSQPLDEFVFWQPASAAACACCGDGWVMAVSARNALTVLGGAISAGGPVAGLSYPAWADASELGSGCQSDVELPGARGFDLTSPSEPAAPLDDATVHAALDAVWHTALPLALTKKHYVFDAVVLRYAATFGGAGPELVVFVNSGWLE